MATARVVSTDAAHRQITVSSRDWPPGMMSCSSSTRSFWCAHTAHTGAAGASWRPRGPPQSRHVSTAARPRKIKANPGATSFLPEHHLGLFHLPKSKGILLRPLKTLLRPAYNHTWSPKNVCVSDVTFSAKQQNPHHWDSWEEK